MSLVGNLEDLGLGEILQIVSLSRKSGILSLQSRQREGKVVFRDGQVVRALSSVFRESLADALVREKAVSPDTLRRAVAISRTGDPSRPVAEVLAEDFEVDRDTLDKAAKEQIEKVVYSFFGWAEGTFDFTLGELETLEISGLHPLHPFYEPGLNPQWLAMEGSRILDEKRHSGEALEEEGQPVVDTAELLGENAAAEGGDAQELAEADDSPASPGTGEASSGLLFLLDDDPQLREELAEALEERGLPIEAFADAAELLEATEKAAAAGAEPTLVIDLIMPQSDGGGLLGGLEVLEKVRSDFPHLPVMVISDHANQDAEQQIRSLGVPALIPKPKKVQIQEGEGQRAIKGLADTISDLLTGPPKTGGSGPSNWSAELLAELGESATGSPAERGPESPGLHLLRGMLQELNNPSLGGGIILLVLRFASELMNRAVIFLVKEREIVGLGQFGIETEGESADARVRRMKVRRDEDSIFSGVLATGSPQKVQLGDGPWDRYLSEQFGGGQPEEVFLGPLMSEGKVVAVLYGDNLPEKTPIGDTEALEIFLAQAGLAMEKALLERRLRGREAI